MATNKFKIFDEQGNEMMTDAEYTSASQRVAGVVPGLADAKMHNKLYRQCSIMATAIGRVLGEFNLDAPDDNVVALANNIKSLFCFDILSVYPVGAIYISASAVNPAQLFGGTWEQIKGKFLLAADSSHAAGTTGGEESHTLTVNEIPTHGHNVTVEASGKHSHTGTTADSGNHNHTRGTMNITGAMVGWAHPTSHITYTGAIYRIRSHKESGGGYDYSDNPYNDDIGFDASRAWVGNTSTNGAHNHEFATTDGGEHSHLASSENTGGGKTHNNMPPYLSVYVWKRIA